MRYISVCSGIEAASVAWHDFGWTPVAFSEIEPFPSAVLQHHYPHVPNLGDMTKFKEWNLEPIDLLVGGTPCQSFSVAGLRKGLHDPRGGLMLTFLEIAQRYRPRWVVWENVPGVLSSNGGRDFGAFLGALGELGYGWAYRVLDAQWFGVAQRRRRVFVVGCLGDQASAAAVLFESESVQRNPAPSREKRKDTTGSTGDGLARCVTAGEMKRQDWETCNMVAQPVAGSHWDSPANPHPTLNQSAKGSGGIAASDQELFSQRGSGLVAQPVAFHHNAQASQLPTDARDTSISDSLTVSQQAAVALPVAFKVRGGVEVDSAGKTAGKGYLGSEETAFTLAATQDQWVAQPPTFALDEYNQTGHEEVCYPLRTASGDGIPKVNLQQMQVRRLTPVECSRLQGFPDTYLELTYGTESEAHASQVLHELWKQTGAIAREGWRPGIVASLFTPEVLLAGVHGGWISWEMATCCAIAPRPLSSKVNYAERFVRRLQEAGQDGRSPYQRESFRQLSEELGCSLSQLPLEEAQARKVLLNSELWPQAQAQWPLRYALATEKQRSSGKLNADGPRYKALGNSMAVPCMKWIGERINAIEEKHT